MAQNLERPQLIAKHAVHLFFVTVYIISAAVLVSVTVTALTETWGGSPSGSPSVLGRLIVCICIFSMARFLFLVRKHRLREYSYLELGAALATAWDVTSQNIPGQPPVAWHSLVGLAGATYIAVRGFVNLDEYLAKIQKKE